MTKPHASYEDWKDSKVTLHLSNGDILAEVIVIDLWMTAAGPPLALACIFGIAIINVPFERVMYYQIHTE